VQGFGWKCRFWVTVGSLPYLWVHPTRMRCLHRLGSGCQGRVPLTLVRLGLVGLPPVCDDDIERKGGAKKEVHSRLSVLVLWVCPPYVMTT